MHLLLFLIFKLPHLVSNAHEAKTPEDVRVGTFINGDVLVFNILNQRRHAPCSTGRFIKLNCIKRVNTPTSPHPKSSAPRFEASGTGADDILCKCVREKGGRTDDGGR